MIIPFKKRRPLGRSKFTSSNLLLLSSEHGREYTKNTCHRTFGGRHLSTDKERERCLECRFSREEVYDTGSKTHIASIAYDPSRCYIEFLSVDEKFQKQGIGSDLANRAIEDMRANHGCREISLYSLLSAEGFWKKTGAISKRGNSHVFPDSSPNLS